MDKRKQIQEKNMSGSKGYHLSWGHRLLQESKYSQKYLICRQKYKDAKDSGDWSELTTMYNTMFSSFSEINAMFKVGDLPSLMFSSKELWLQTITYHIIRCIISLYSGVIISSDQTKIKQYKIRWIKVKWWQLWCKNIDQATMYALSNTHSRF